MNRSFLHKCYKGICKVEIAFVVTLILVFTLFFSEPTIIGGASTNIRYQDFEITASESKTYYLNFIDESHPLNSIRISGTVKGAGVASVYLSDGNIKLLVFNNFHIRRKSPNMITGFFANDEFTASKMNEVLLDVTEGPSLKGYDALPKGYETVEGSFQGACFDTCLLELVLKDKKTYELQVYVEPGTTIKINEIIYTALEKITS